MTEPNSELVGRVANMLETLIEADDDCQMIARAIIPIICAHDAARVAILEEAAQVADRTAAIPKDPESPWAVACRVVAIDIRALGGNNAVG